MLIDNATATAKRTMLDFGNFKDVLKVEKKLTNIRFFHTQNSMQNTKFTVLNIHLLWPENLRIFLQDDKNLPLYGQWSKS